MGKRSRRRPERSGKRAYKHAVRRWENDKADATDAFGELLRDPAHCEAIGLVPETATSDVAVEALSWSRTEDKLGPRKPKISRYIARDASEGVVVEIAAPAEPPFSL